MIIDTYQKISNSNKLHVSVYFYSSTTYQIINNSFQYVSVVQPPFGIFIQRVYVETLFFLTKWQVVVVFINAQWLLWYGCAFD